MDLGRLLLRLTIGGTFFVNGTQKLFGWFGILTVLGPATPLAAAGLSALMITALRTAVWNEAIKPATGEHEVLLAVAALALTETGPGAPSLDSAIGIERRGSAWTLAALGAGVAGSAMAIGRDVDAAALDAGQRPESRASRSGRFISPHLENLFWERPPSSPERITAWRPRHSGSRLQGRAHSVRRPARRMV
jgi:putative oxidoreductase